MNIRHRHLTEEEKERLVRKRLEEGFSFGALARMYGINISTAREIFYRRVGSTRGKGRKNSGKGR